VRSHQVCGLLAVQRGQHPAEHKHFGSEGIRVAPWHGLQERRTQLAAETGMCYHGMLDVCSGCR
jgi:hypothetical protein